MAGLEWSLNPAREAPPGEFGSRRVPMDTQHLLPQRAERRETEGEVGQWRHRGARSTEPRRPGDDPIAKRDALLALELVTRLRVDLGDLHPLRAGHRADPAAGAIVDRSVDRGLVEDPVALGLRTGVLRPREQRRDVRDRALRLADRALDAVVERPAHQLVRGRRARSCRRTRGRSGVRQYDLRSARAARQRDALARSLAPRHRPGKRRRPPRPRCPPPRPAAPRRPRRRLAPSAARPGNRRRTGARPARAGRAAASRSTRSCVAQRESSSIAPEPNPPAASTNHVAA